jgi:hypothetical protein
MKQVLSFLRRGAETGPICVAGRPAFYAGREGCGMLFANDVSACKDAQEGRQDTPLL